MCVIILRYDEVTLVSEAYACLVPCTMHRLQAPNCRLTVILYIIRNVGIA